LFPTLICEEIGSDFFRFWVEGAEGGSGSFEEAFWYF